MATFAFSGGVAPDAARGQKSKVRFGGTWVDGDTWRIDGVSTLSGNFTLGKGNISGQTFTGAKTLRNRMYLAFGSNFAMSAVGDPTGWEDQGIGAAVVPYLSQYGGQDTVTAFASTQGRLAVFGERSIQIWGINADPNQFELIQALDNAGTIAQKSVQSIGDADVLYLDSSGIRSLRAKETSLNSSVNDIGTAIDELIRVALVSYDASLAVAVVEPTTRQYWLFLNGDIYVLSYFPESKVVAWSTYKATYDPAEVITADQGTYQPPLGFVNYTTVIGDTYYWTKAGSATSLKDALAGNTILANSGSFVATVAQIFEFGTNTEVPTTVLRHTGKPFTPTHMVIHDKRVYVRASNSKIYLYGGTNNNSYDYSPLVVELPWLNFKKGKSYKSFETMDVAFAGNWLFETSSDPTQSFLRQAISRGSNSTANMALDSTFDKGTYSIQGNGVHLKIRGTSISPIASKLGALAISFNQANLK